MENVIPENIKSKSFLKRQAHCGECSSCFYDQLFCSWYCLTKAKFIHFLDKFACEAFIYENRDLNSNWENEYIYGAKRTW